MEHLFYFVKEEELVTNQKYPPPTHQKSGGLNCSSSSRGQCGCEAGTGRAWVLCCVAGGTQDCGCPPDAPALWVCVCGHPLREHVHPEGCKGSLPSQRLCAHAVCPALDTEPLKI